MCEYCTKHGDGQTWYKNAKNYSEDLQSDLWRQKVLAGYFDHVKLIKRSMDVLKQWLNFSDQAPKFIQRFFKNHYAVKYKVGQVLPLEEVEEVVQKAASIVRVPCACRWAQYGTDDRCCYPVAYNPKGWWEALKIPKEFDTPPTTGLEVVSSAEVIADMREFEKTQKRIHTIWTMGTPFITTICNCDMQGCLGTKFNHALGGCIVMKAEFFAKINHESCKGCGQCERVCTFKAISPMTLDGGKKVAVVDPEKCFGCGLCRNVCKTKSISLVERSKVKLMPFVKLRPRPLT